MQKIKISGYKKSESQYFAAMGMVVKEGRFYTATISMLNRRRPNTKQAAFKIQIESTNHDTVLKQLHKIVDLFPPVEDIEMLDVSNIEELYHE